MFYDWSHMSRVKSLAECFIVLMLLVSAQVVQAKEMVSVSRPEINMRAGAGTGHPALWAINKGYPLEVTGRKGRWLKVRDFENDTGWVYRPLVGKTPYHVVKARVANIRSAPSTRSRIVGKAEGGDVLRTLGARGNWIKVKADGGPKGWVARRLLWGW